MQTPHARKRARLRLPILMAGSSLAIGSVVWLMVSFWPRSNLHLHTEATVVERPVAAASGPVKALTGTTSGSRATRGGVGQSNGLLDPAMRAAGANGNRTPRPIVIPALTETNRIAGPVPWRNGPPVRTPQPGAPAAKAPGTPNPNRLAVPNAGNGMGNTRALPFLPPVRNTAARPAPPTPPAQAKDGKEPTDGN